jgi:hypothetical protein
MRITRRHIHVSGCHPFTKDAVRRVLLNRFYLADLPNDDGGWLPGVMASRRAARLRPVDVFA